MSLQVTQKLVLQRLRELQATLSPQYICFDRYRISLKEFTVDVLSSEKMRLRFITAEIHQSMVNLTFQQIVDCFQTGLNLYQEEIGESRGQLDAVQRELISQQEVVIDIPTGEFWLWNRKTRKKSTWNINTYFSRFPAAVVNKMKAKAVLAIKTFDPYKGLQKEWPGISEGIAVKYLNTYNPPAWYDKDFLPSELNKMRETYPTFFLFFLEKLIPIPEHRDLVLDWIALAIFNRPISYLCLRGIRGSGKSVFKLLIYHLVGNFYECQDKVLTEFNADIMEKRLVGIDDKKEIGSRNGYYLRKNLLNPTMAFETKFVQTLESGRQYASVLILSNNSDAFYMEYDERRILSPLMGTEKMETWATEQQYSWLKAFEDKTIAGGHLDFIRQIGRSLLVRYYHRSPSPNIQLKTGYFWSDVLDSLPSFYRYVLNNISLRSPDNCEVEYEELRAMYKLEENFGNIPHWATFTRWLQSGFQFMGNSVLDLDLPEGKRINYTDKSFQVNPALCKKETT